MFVAETLKYVMKPTNLFDWTPVQVAQFNALGRTKLRECYGAMRGLVGEIEDDGEGEIGLEPEEIPLGEGDPCPDCGAPLMAQWLSRQELQAVEQASRTATSPPLNHQMPVESFEEGGAGAHKPQFGVSTGVGGLQRSV